MHSQVEPTTKYNAVEYERLKEENNRGYCPVSHQDGRTWQPFVGSKNGNENFRQARIYNFRVKCVVLARNCKFAKLTQ